MIIIGAKKEDIEAALEHANKYFNGNLRFKTLDYLGFTRDKRVKVTCTLTVNDSKDIGSRRNFEGGRIAAACWHAHGVFFDALPAGTEIRSCQTIMHAGDKWQDYNMGSIAYPLQASRACNCMEWNNGGVLPFPVNAS